MKAKAQILIVCVIVGLALVLAGFAGYRIGYLRGNEDALRLDWMVRLYLELTDLNMIKEGQYEQLIKRKRAWIFSLHEWFHTEKTAADYMEGRPSPRNPEKWEKLMIEAKAIADEVREQMRPFPTPEEIMEQIDRQDEQ